jgi:pimeloyl-ACP methyl ester carboxylesterase
MAYFAEHLAGLLDNLGLADAHLLGLSWGGICILEFYRLFPRRVRSAILANTYAGWTGSLGEEAARDRLKLCLAQSRMSPEAWVPGWVPDAFSSHAPTSLLKDYGDVMSDFHPAGFRAMSRACAPDFSDIMPTIQVPALLIWGDDDKRSPMSVAEEMHQSIPKSHLTVIPDAGHISNFEQPTAFNSAVRAFLGNLG